MAIRFRILRDGDLMVTWWEVMRALGHDHRGLPEDDEELIRQLLDAGAPSWVSTQEGYVDEFGWFIRHPEEDDSYVD